MLGTHVDKFPTPAPPTDASGALVHSIGAEELFREHASFITSFLRRLGASPDEVDDLVQDVFLIAHRRGGFVPGAAKPQTWLAEIAIRVCSSVRRKGRRRQTGFPPSELELATPTDGVLNRVAALQALVRVQQALDAMDLEHRVVFLLATLDGASGESIATTMQIPIGTVHSRLHHARRMFRHAYERLACDQAPSTVWRVRTDPSFADRRRDDDVRLFLAASTASFDLPRGLARLRAKMQALQAGFAVGSGAGSGGITAGASAKVLVSSIAVIAAFATVSVVVALRHAEGAHSPPLAALQVERTTSTATAPPVATAPPAEAATVDVVTGAETPVLVIAGSGRSTSRATEVPSGHPAQPRRSADDDGRVMAEVQQVAQLRSLAESNPAAALALADEGNRMFVGGALRQEREAIAVASIVRLGRLAEARKRAQSFLADYPRGPFATRVRSLVGVDDDATAQ